MSETPRPVRAWAEYDEWSVFLNSMPMAGPWFVAVPKGAKDHAIVDMLSEMGRDAIRWLTTPEPVIFHPGPLRSIRILLSTGHTIWLYGVISWRDHSKRLCWRWYLREGRAELVRGDIPTDTTDTDAVSRALAEAVAWIEEQGQEGVTA